MWLSKALVNAALALERVDEAMIPAMFLVVGSYFNATPAQLGALASAQALTKAISTPFGGVAGAYCSRVKLIAIGCIVWATTATSFAFTSSLKMGMLFWALNGVGIGVMIPNGESLVADFNSSRTRGCAFGLLFLVGNVGALVGGLYGTTFAGSTILGRSGWRFVCLSTAATGTALGALTWLFAADPPRPQVSSQGSELGASGPGKLADLCSKSMEVLAGIRAVLAVPSFMLLVLEGTLNSMATFSQRFLTLYLQLAGLSDGASAAAVGLVQAGTAAGGLLGGVLGDAVVLRWPVRGRANLAAASHLSGLLLFCVLLKAVPQSSAPAGLVAYSGLALLWSLVRSWSVPCCHNPTLAEVVPTRLRSVAYAFGRSLESAVGGAVAAPLVGLIAEGWFHYDTSVKARGVGDVANAVALGNAVMVGVLVPTFLSALCFFGLNFTLAKDMQRALLSNEAGLCLGSSPPCSKDPLLRENREHP